MDSIIEQGTYDDVDELEQLYNDLNDALKEGVNYPGWRKGIYPIREDAIVGIDHNNLFVAKYDNKIVGSIILNHEPENAYDSVNWQSDNDYSKIFVVHTLAVHPDYSKKGIGRQLLNFADSFGAQNGITSIRLDVYENNTPAIKLYESCGYEYIATVDLGLSNYGLDWFKLFEKLL